MTLPNPNPPPAPVPLAPGFRFHPTDEELVIYYLKRKILNRPLKLDAIAEIDLYKLEPWELPPKSRIRSRDLEWYFFSPLDRKYSNKSRTNRATKEGYWKTTGKDREVKRGEKIVGMKKTLVFHMGRAPSGKRTNWVMHEYRIEGDGVLDEVCVAGTDKAQDLYVVCRIFQKTGSGPQNGAQYGAPFMEEEWENETAGDDAMADVMRPGKDEEEEHEEEREFVQMTDLLPSQTPQIPDPSLISTDFDANSKPTNQPIKQEIEESNHTDLPAENSINDHENTNENYENTNENYENTNGNYIMTDWAAQDASWPLRTRGDTSLPNSSEFDNSTLSEILNVEEFFDNSIHDENNNENNLETGQTGETAREEDAIRPAGMCDYEYLEDEGKTVFYDVENDGEVASGEYFDDLMAYFDETDIKYDISGSVCESTKLVESSKNVEEENNEMEFNASIKTEQKEIYKGESSCASSSCAVEPSFEDINHLKRKTFDMPSDFSDIHGDEYSDKSSIRKRLVSMLGSMSAPKPIASEFPSSSSKSMAAANSAGPIRVTAGIIQIVNLNNANDSWLERKTGTDCDNLVLKLVPTENGNSDDEVAVFTVFRGGFYLFFMSMAILTISYKLSMCVYGR
ncbi:hypothetical protein LUZ60_006922 [Juncus effusus]|nr:hypothetical protein LUZ60_006922 [Juncus effusus]